MVSRFNRCHRARWKKWQKHSELQGREVDIILCQRTFLSAVRIQKRCRAIFGKHHEVDVQNSSEKVLCRLARVSCVKRRFDTGFAASGTQTGFSTDPMPEVPPGVARSLSSHSADVYTRRISRSFV